MFENFCSDIIQTMKYFALESFNLSCQAEHTKINSRLTFNPGLALIAFWTTRPSATIYKSYTIQQTEKRTRRNYIYKSAI